MTIDTADFLLCEHFELPDTLPCEYCNAYPNCSVGRHSGGAHYKVEIYDWDWDAANWPDENQDDYDYTEGDIGQDGII